MYIQASKKFHYLSCFHLAKKVSSRSSKSSAGEASAKPRAKKSTVAKPTSSVKAAAAKLAKPRTKKTTATARLAEALAKHTEPIKSEGAAESVALLDAGEVLARSAAEYALTKKALDITIMDVRNLSDSIDFFVICSADSDRQVKAISDAVFDGLADEGEKPKHVERKDLTWVVMDYIDVVVHIFLKEKRAFYNLEKLWGDAKFIRIDDHSTAAVPAKKRQTTA